MSSVWKAIDLCSSFVPRSVDSRPSTRPDGIEATCCLASHDEAGSPEGWDTRYGEVIARKEKGVSVKSKGGP